MSSFVPKVLIYGHSFVRRLHDDLARGFDSHAKANFNLAGSGVAISSEKSDVIIWEIGTNDLSSHAPEVVGSCIEKLAHFFLDEL